MTELAILKNDTKNSSSEPFIARPLKIQIANINSQTYRIWSIYRNILCKAKEVGIKSIAVCVVSTVQRNFPPDIGAHIALSK